jgi:hypothetical protein
MKTTRPGFRQWFALSQACVYGLAGLWVVYTFPGVGGLSLGNGRLVVGSIFFAFAVGWLEAFRRFRRASKKAQDWLA